jgi:spore coat polysaccharide biosynthesis protein SpsF
MSAEIAVFVQARMSSQRFPGKVLAPFQGRPIIAWVVQAVSRALPELPIVVATSREPSDDPLAAYLAACGIRHFRGPLDDVFERFRACLAENPCAWILRICADSPLLDERVLQAVVDPVLRGESSADIDLITTTAPRTFPKGHNAELINAATFTNLDAADLTAHDREHVTAYFHRSSDRFRIVNVSSGEPNLASLSFAVDTVDDLHRLEALDARSARSSALNVSPPGQK